jgi:hypothetical protein
MTTLIIDNKNDTSSSPADINVTADHSTPGGESQREDTTTAYSILTRPKKWQHPQALNKCVKSQCSGFRGMSFVVCFYVSCAGKY